MRPAWLVRPDIRERRSLRYSGRLGSGRLEEGVDENGFIQVSCYTTGLDMSMILANSIIF